MGEGTYGAGTAQVNWGSAADFWAMGGYAFYVWGSYATVVTVVAIEIWMLRARRRHAVSELARESVRKSAQGVSTQ